MIENSSKPLLTSSKYFWTPSIPSEPIRRSNTLMETSLVNYDQSLRTKSNPLYYIFNCSV